MKYIKTGRIQSLIAKADEEFKPLYIQGPIGCGKTAAVEYYYRRISHQTIDCSSGRIELKTDPTRVRSGVIVFDNISYLNDDASIKYVLDVVRNSNKHIIFISRTPRPVWMAGEPFDRDMIIADQRDMHFSKEHCFKFLEAAGVQAAEEDMIIVMEEARSNPLVLGCIAYYMKEVGRYSKEVNTFARINYYNYLDKELLGRLTQEEQDFLLSMCWYPKFSYEMARQIYGRECLPIVDSIQRKNAYILTFATAGVELMNNLVTYFRHKRNLLWDEKRHVDNLCRAAEFYEAANSIGSALSCYETAHADERMIELLEKTARNDLSSVTVYRLREFYLKLSEESVSRSWLLTAARSLVESLMIKPGLSEKWFSLLKKMYESEQDPRTKDEIGRRVVYLDLILPHHGTKNLAERCQKLIDIRKKEDEILNTEYVDLMPTVIHGIFDLCEYAVNEDSLFKKAAELGASMNGRAAEAMIDLMKAELAYEKESLDHYRIFKLLNSGYMIADTENSCGGCFAAVGISAHLHLNRGELARTEEILDSIRSKTVQTENDALLGNIDALYGWVDQLHANRENVLAWLETAPDEGVGFTFFERSVMICKVRAYIILGKFQTALDLIERLLTVFEMYGRVYAACEVKLYQAIIYYRLKNDEYVQLINEVIEKAFSLGFYHIISDHGAAVLPLLEKERPESVSKKYYDQLLKLTRQMAENYPNYLATAEELKEPLTKTERRVLHLLCEGLTAEEICQIMGISYSGIKFHNKNIYRKLEVNNRVEAVRIAFKMGLNEPGI